MIVIGICLAYAFTSLHQTIRRYTALRQELCCNELADEYLARFIATFLTAPPEFDATLEGAGASITEKGYVIDMKAEEYTSTTPEKREPSSESKERAALVTLIVAVHPFGNKQISAVRTSHLCLTQEAMR